jgi:phosphoketolase
MKSDVTVLKAALKLPRKSRAKLAEELLHSLVPEDVIIEGGKLAEERWQAYRRGETRAKPSRQALQAIVATKRKT